MATLEELNQRLNSLESQINDIEGVYFPFEELLTDKNKLSDIRYFESTENFYKLKKGQTYNLNYLLENIGATGQTTGDITFLIEYSTDNTISNISGDQILNLIVTNIIIPPNKSLISNSIQIEIPENAEYIRLFAAFNLSSGINPGVTKISLHFYDPQEEVVELTENI